MPEIETLKEMLKHLQNIEIEYAKDKEKWAYVKRTLEWLSKDKYARYQGLKHCETTVGEVLDGCLEHLTK